MNMFTPTRVSIWVVGVQTLQTAVVSFTSFALFRFIEEFLGNQEEAEIQSEMVHSFVEVCVCVCVRACVRACVCECV